MELGTGRSLKKVEWQNRRSVTEQRKLTSNPRRERKGLTCGKWSDGVPYLPLRKTGVS